MACHALASVRLEIQSYLYIYHKTNSTGFGFVCLPGTVVKPKSDGTALTINNMDDPLSPISKDFTGGVVIVEVGLKKMCNCGRDVRYKTMVSRHQVHFLHQTHGI